MDYLHLLTNIFAGGRSELKLYMFIVYFLVLGGVALYKYRKPLLQKPQSYLSRFFVSTAALFLIGFILHLCLLSSYGIDWNQHAVIFNNGEISSSSIWHNHALKGTIATIATFFFSGVSQSVDIGTAFVGLFPAFIYVGSLILLLASIYLAIRAFISIDTSSYSAKRHALLWIAYSIFTFSILKNTIDGGILNVEAIPAIFGLYLLCVASDRNKRIGINLLVVIAFGLALANALLVIFRISVHTSFLVPHFVSMVTLVAFLAYANWKAPSKRLLIGLFILFLLGACAGTERDRSFISYGDAQLIEESIVVSKENLPPDFVLLDTIGQIKIYSINNPSYTPREISEMAKVPVNFQAVSVPYVTCVPESPLEYYKLKVSTEQRDFSLQKAKSRFYEVGEMNGGEVVVGLHPCLGRQVEVIQELFASSGLNTFIISDLGRLEHE